MLIATVLALLTLTDQITIPLLYLLTATGSATRAFGDPAQQALVPNLVPREHLTNAVSLNVLRFYGTSVVGPAVAGYLVSWFSLGVVYAINAATFTGMLAALLLIRHRQPQRATSGLGWQGLKTGFRFTFGTRIIWGSMLLDFIATFFSSARTMLPIIAENILGSGVRGYGLLSSAQPAGAVIAGVYLALKSDMKKQGIILLVSVGIYGLGTVLFGFSTVFWLSFLFLAATGAADTVSSVIRGAIRQLSTPDELRGRMTGINMMFYMGGPQLGELEAGLVAAAFGAPFAIISGGVVTMLLTGLIAWRYPSLRAYD
jgi:MFS family permease